MTETPELTDIVDETAAVVERPTFQNRHPQLEAAARAIATLTTKEYAQDEIWEEDLELFYKQFARNERTSPMTAAWEALQSVERLSRERDTGVPEKFREWMMGFPIGWTQLGPPATPSSRKSPNSSVKRSKRKEPTYE